MERDEHGQPVSDGPPGAAGDGEGGDDPGQATLAPRPAGAREAGGSGLPQPATPTAARVSRHPFMPPPEVMAEIDNKGGGISLLMSYLKIPPAIGGPFMQEAGITDDEHYSVTGGGHRL